MDLTTCMYMYFLLSNIPGIFPEDTTQCITCRKLSSKFILHCIVYNFSSYQHPERGRYMYTVHVDTYSMYKTVEHRVLQY